MKFVPSDAVAWLEAKYDDYAWSHTDDWDSPDHVTGWLTTQVIDLSDDRKTHSVLGRPYGGPMFGLKDLAEAGPSEDVSASSAGWDCYLCEARLSHLCGRCQTTIDHMTGPLCLACWSTPVGAIVTATDFMWIILDDGTTTE